MLILQVFIKDLGGEIPQPRLLELARQFGEPVAEPISEHFSEYFIASGLAPARVLVREENVLFGGHEAKLQVFLKLFTYGVALWDYGVVLPPDLEAEEAGRLFQHRSIELPSRGASTFLQLFETDHAALQARLNPHLEGKYEDPGFIDRFSVFIDEPGRDQEDGLAILLPGTEPYSANLKRRIIQHVDLRGDQDHFMLIGNRAYLSTSLPPAELVSFLTLARVQLHELKIFDRLLDASIEETYEVLDQFPLTRMTWPMSWLGTGSRRQMQRILRMTSIRMELVDLIKDITNSTKITADPFYELVYRQLLESFRISEWFSSVKDKVNEIEGVHRIFMQRFDTSNSMFLEALIVFLIMFEIAMSFLR